MSARVSTLLWSVANVAPPERMLGQGQEERWAGASSSSLA